MKPTKKVEDIILPANASGTNRKLSVIRYGKPKTGKKVYIQAGLHADEPPGFIAVHYLIKLLDEADKAGKIQGEIVLVPMANPIGLSQWHDDRLVGRYDFSTSINFNRAYPELKDAVAKKIRKKLQKSSKKNIELIRKAQLECLNELTPVDETQYLKFELMKMAVDADIVLDLHCDDQAFMHIYMGTPLWPDATDLAAQMGSRVTLLAKNSGGEPFDEACSKIWWELDEMFENHEIPAACLSATVELRGTSDVTHDYGSADAKNLFTFLKRRGYIKGIAPKLPRLLRDATPLSAVEHLKADRPGIVIYRKSLGETIKKGDIVAEILTPQETDPTKRITKVRAKSGGFLFTKNTDRYAKPNRILAKIAGKEPIKSKGSMLLTD